MLRLGTSPSSSAQELGRSRRPQRRGRLTCSCYSPAAALPAPPPSLTSHNCFWSSAPHPCPRPARSFLYHPPRPAFLASLDHPASGHSSTGRPAGLPARLVRFSP